jgi:arylformamidase
MTPLRPRVDWRSLDRASLDKAYNNAAAFANSSAMVAAWEQRSAALRAQHGGVLDLAYGPLPRNRIDFLKSTASAVPTLIFLHGGYWQMRSKDSFTFVASGPLSAGINVALVGYTLAPDATMDQMVAEIRDALDWLTSALQALNADPSKILLSGWSAGAHLAAAVMDHPSVRGCVAISGIYDLEPMRHCYVNDKLGLDEDSARRNSPIRQQSKPSRPLVVVVGGAELPLMYQQSMDYARERIKCGLPVVFDEIPEADHFSILEDTARSDGRLTALVREAVVAAGISSANR